MQTAKTTVRDNFTGKWGFILASIGSAVGMGNIWRFPIMISMWGGLSFLLPYLLCVCIIAVSGMIGEFALGRATSSGPLGAFAYCTMQRFSKKNIGRVLAMLPILGSLDLAIGYTVVMGWVCKYFYLALSANLSHLGQNMSEIATCFTNTATSNALFIILAIIVSASIMSFGIAKGIEKANKLMMPTLFILFVLLCLYISSLPGAIKGYHYIFQLDLAKLKNPLLWLFAFGQAFFSLSVAGNGSLIYGSYLPKNKDVFSSALRVAFFDTVAAMLAAITIIPAMASANAPLDKSGPGLMFIFLVNVFNGLQASYLVSVIFFTCVLFAGVSSLINLYETPVATLQEELHFKRVPATLIVHVISLFIALLIQPITGEWMDIVSIYICPLGALIAAVMFYWFLPHSFVLQEVNRGSKREAKYFYYLAKYVYCTLCVLALLAGAYFGGIG